MTQPALSRFGGLASARRAAGYTLVEILVATTLALILLGAVVRMFGDVGRGITDSRAVLEARERLGIAAVRLQADLAGVTVTMDPPRRPESNEGYFEYIEGPATQATASTYAVNTETGAATPPPDSTVGDFDDILMFTTRSNGRPFVGRFGTDTRTSDVAEVAWFVRGRTLYRRQLLVVPSVTLPAGPAPGYPGFYKDCDISARLTATGLVPNTLGDLTRRECRFAHPADVFPYDVSRWQWTYGGAIFPMPPTLRECSSADWRVDPNFIPPPPPPISLQAIPSPYLDFWTNDTRRRIADNALVGPMSIPDGTRIADDVILSNVIGFDVKAWDPTAPVLYNSAQNRTLLPGDTGYALEPLPAGFVISTYGAYVDLGYLGFSYSTAYTKDTSPTPPAPNRATHLGLGHWGHPKSFLNAASGAAPRVYDTFSFHYENVGSSAGRATNGFDDDGNGIVDDIVYTGLATAGENWTAPPYPVRLRGTQVKIRTFEPDSRQILEWTVVQDFLPQ